MKSQMLPQLNLLVKFIPLSKEVQLTKIHGQRTSTRLQRQSPIEKISKEITTGISRDLRDIFAMQKEGVLLRKCPILIPHGN